jgi:hypothetical protein
METCTCHSNIGIIMKYKKRRLSGSTAPPRPRRDAAVPAAAGLGRAHQLAHPAQLPGRLTTGGAVIWSPLIIVCMSNL